MGIIDLIALLAARANDAAKTSSRPDEPSTFTSHNGVLQVFWVLTDVLDLWWVWWWFGLSSGLPQLRAIKSLVRLM